MSGQTRLPPKPFSTSLVLTCLFSCNLGVDHEWASQPIASVDQKFQVTFLNTKKNRCTILLSTKLLPRYDVRTKQAPTRTFFHQFGLDLFTFMQSWVDHKWASQPIASVDQKFQLTFLNTTNNRCTNYSAHNCFPARMSGQSQLPPKRFFISLVLTCSLSCNLGVDHKWASQPIASVNQKFQLTFLNMTNNWWINWLSTQLLPRYDVRTKPAPTRTFFHQFALDLFTFMQPWSGS
jgi:hypothetical protein